MVETTSKPKIPETQVPQPPVNHPKNNSLFVILLLVLMTIIASVAVTYLFISNKIPNPLTIKTSFDAGSTRPGTTANWQTYTDNEAGFSFQYPPTVLLNGEVKGASKMVLSVSKQLINDIKEQPFTSKEIALADKIALEKGEIVGTSWASDSNLVNLGIVNGKAETTLAAFEECSVILNRSLTFYNDEYQINISLTGVKDQITSDMPEYFIDKKACGGKIWDLDNQTQAKFLTALKNKQGKGSGQVWFDAFDEIVKTIKIAQKSAANNSGSVSPTPVASNVNNNNGTGCQFIDSSFCPVVENIKAAITSKNTQSLYSYLDTQSIDCDPDGLFIPICDGVAKGTTKTGYMLGYNQSEGAIYTESQAINIVDNYIFSNTVEYKRALQENDKAIIVYLVDNKLKLLTFPFKKENGKWRMKYILMGGATAEFLNLDKSLLQIVN